MGSPAYNIDQIEFDDPEDPELAELLDLPDAVVHAPAAAAPANDNSDLFDAPEPDGEPAATPEQFEQGRLAYEADVRAGKIPGARLPANDNAGMPSFITYKAPAEDATRQARPEARHMTEAQRLMTAFGAERGQMDDEAEPTQPGRMSYGEAMAIGERNPFEMGAEAQGFGRKMAAMGQGPVPRTTGRGIDAPLDTRSEYEVGKGIADEEAARALEQQPGDYRTGQALTETIALAPSMAVAPLAAGGRLALGAGGAALRAAPSIGEAAGANMAQAFPVGALTGAGASEGETPLEIAEDAATGGNVAAIGAGGLTGMVGAAARGAPALANKARAAADRWRAAATGMFGDEADKLTRMYGPEYLESLGAHIERMGLNKKPGGAVGPIAMPVAGGVIGAGYGAATSDDDTLEGRAMNALKYGAGGAAAGMALGRVSTPRVYAENAARATKQLGAQIGAIIDDASAQGASFSKKELAHRMRQVLRTYDTNTDEGIALRAKVRGLIERVNDKYGDTMTPRELQDLKRSYLKKETGGFTPTSNTPQSDTSKAEMYRKVAKVPNRAVMETIAELPRKPQSPDMSTFGKLQQAKRDYRVAKTVENAANRRVGREAGNQPLSLLSASTGSVPGAIAAEITKRGGRDIGADVLRGVQRVAEGSQAAKAIMRGIPGSSPGARVERAVGEGATGLLGSMAGAPAHAQSSGEDKQPLMNRIRELAKSDPQQLGEWGPFLATSKTTDEFNVRHSTLMAKDTKYRERIRRIAEQKKAESEGQATQEQVQ